MKTIETLEAELALWKDLAKRAADEAAVWYDESRGRHREDLPVVRDIDALLAREKQEGKP